MFSSIVLCKYMYMMFIFGEGFGDLRDGFEYLTEKVFSCLDTEEVAKATFVFLK